ncbi:MAG: hypothetical protein JWR46_3941 [Mycobacterium sp.]|nr:hypothetical protein [Mycobacterium sp.]
MVAGVKEWQEGRAAGRTAGFSRLDCHIEGQRSRIDVLARLAERGHGWVRRVIGLAAADGRYEGRAECVRRPVCLHAAGPRCRPA